MILRVRQAANDARSAALDVFAAARFLAAAGIPAPQVWLTPDDQHRDPRVTAVVDAWTRGVAVVPIDGSDARKGAVATASAIGLRAVDAPPAGSDAGKALDGRRAAARFALGIDPDERVELILRETEPVAMHDRIAAFDARVAEDAPHRHRLILADLGAHGRQLTEPMVGAIVHPLVLIELRQPNPRLISVARIAADAVIEAG